MNWAGNQKAVGSVIYHHLLLIRTGYSSGIVPVINVQYITVDKKCQLKINHFYAYAFPQAHCRSTRREWRSLISSIKRDFVTLVKMIYNNSFSSQSQCQYFKSQHYIINAYLICTRSHFLSFSSHLFIFSDLFLQLEVSCKLYILCICGFITAERRLINVKCLVDRAGGEELHQREKSSGERIWR